MAQLVTIILVLVVLAVLRFGLPILGIWLINKGCCILQTLRV
jgi:hypothetical protein